MGKALVAWLEMEDEMCNKRTNNNNNNSSNRNTTDNNQEKDDAGGTFNEKFRDSEDSSDEEDEPSNNKSHEKLNNTYLYHTKLDVFIVWLRTALSREYLASCKFDESSGTGGPFGDHGDDNSSESSTMTHSTIKSRMKAARKGSIIMPFRADTAECLFISSIIHSASLKYTILYHLLFSVLRPVALAPENYTYPKMFAPHPPPPSVANTNANTPHTALPPSIDQSRMSGNFSDYTSSNGPSSRDGNSGRASSIRRNSARIYGMFRHIFHSHTAPNTPAPHHMIVSSPYTHHADGSMTPNPSQSSQSQTPHRPSSADMAKVLKNYYHFLNPATSSSASSSGKNNVNLPGASSTTKQQQQMNFNELVNLTPFELKRVETRKRLHDCALLLVNRFDEICQYFPLPIKMIIKTIRDLIIITATAVHPSASTSQLQAEAVGSLRSSSFDKTSPLQTQPQQQPPLSTPTESRPGSTTAGLSPSLSFGIADVDNNSNNPHHSIPSSGIPHSASLSPSMTAGNNILPFTSGRDSSIRTDHTFNRDSMNSQSKENFHHSRTSSLDEESIEYKNRRRFEYGTYFTSCSALLFLRLICRAIITPDDYGVIDQCNVNSNDGGEGLMMSMINELKGSNSSASASASAQNAHPFSTSPVPLPSTSSPDDDFCSALPYRGTPAMIILAYTLNQVDKLKTEAAAAAAGSPANPSAVNPVMKNAGFVASNKPPLPSSPSYPFHQGSPHYTTEVIQLSKQFGDEHHYKNVRILSFFVFFSFLFSLSCLLGD
jgi:hypothetical protein